MWCSRMHLDAGPMVLRPVGPIDILLTCHNMALPMLHGKEEMDISHPVVDGGHHRERSFSQKQLAGLWHLTLSELLRQGMLYPDCMPSTGCLSQMPSLCSSESREPLPRSGPNERPTTPQTLGKLAFPGSSLLGKG